MREHPATGCIRCPLSATRTTVVWGTGSNASGIMLIGEAPGRYEDIAGNPFVGRAGELLESVLRDIGLKRDDLYISNVVKCRPPDNRDPMPRESEACRDWLEYEVGLIEPGVIVLLGRHAAKLAFPHEQRLPVGIARSMTLLGQPCTVLATYHPAAALRDSTGRMTRQIMHDLRRSRRLAATEEGVS